MPQGYPQPVAYPVPAYPPPAAARRLPDLADEAGDFKPSEATAAYRGRGRYRRGSGKSKFVWIGISLLLTAGLIGGGVYAAKHIIPKRGENGQGEGNSTDPKNGQQVANGQGGQGGSPGRERSIPPPPAVHPHQQLPLPEPADELPDSGADAGAGPDSVGPLRLSYELRIPRDKDNDHSTCSRTPLAAREPTTDEERADRNI